MSEKTNTSDRVSQLSPVKQALFELRDLRARLAAVEQARTEPIAIIGLGCRFPGNANNSAHFWDLLQNGVDAISEVPSDRWDVDTYYDPDPLASGKISTRWGGFLAEIDKFDPHFFGISPREAINLDPQHRLLLEVSWEALEHAGQAPDKLIGSRTGVFVGMSTFDYAHFVLSGDPADIDAYVAQGTTHSAAAGRLSYLLGFQGPNLAVDTACSSSLAAIHLAVQSLRNHECNMALAGGVNVILLPEPVIGLSKSQMLAADGHCKTFDARADGFVRAEGCGLIVLKRLSEAQANGDHILAVIRGSAINQDGRSNGLTAPNGLAQEAVIREALANGGVAPEQVGYVEAHGTGTSLGDPIEVQALAATLCQDRANGNRLLIGSVKTNLGHLEAAAGVAGMIKVVLALQHKKIPAHLHLQEPNPYISWAELPIDVPTQLTPFPAINGHYIAGVSSFGFSGTNAHVVLEAAPEPEAVPAEVERPLHLLTLSAKGEAALRELAGHFNRYLEEEAAFADICFTANIGRAHLSHRLALVAASSAQASEKLAAWTAGQSLPGVVTSEVQSTEPPEIVFLFTGQGSQYLGMGRQLYETQPAFRKVLDQCDELLRPYLAQSLLSILFSETGPPSLLDETAYTQPALFALEYALAELWRSWGIEPAAVMGHSVGEYVAACLAGVFNLEDGLKLIAKRAQLMQALPENGMMAAVFTPEVQVIEALKPYNKTVSIAAINGPQNIVISGERRAIQAILEGFEAKGVKTQRLKVSHAFHSPLMEPLLDSFEQTARQVHFKAPQIPLVSNLTGQILQPDEVPDAAYWRRHIREEVRFSTAVETLYEQGYKLFLEVGPNPTLLGMASRCLPEEAAAMWLPSLRQDRDDWQQMLGSLQALYIQGVEVDWLNFDRNYPRRRLHLPTYPFQRQRYWFTSRRQSEASQISSKPVGHPLLGWQLRTASAETIFESNLRVNAPVFLTDHRVYGTAIVPATAYIEMALAAAQIVLGRDQLQLEDIEIHQALIIPDDKQRTVQLILRPEADGVISFKVLSLQEDGSKETVPNWLLHVTGKISPAQVEVDTPVTLETVQQRCHQSVPNGLNYRQLSQWGIEFGPSFQGVKQLWLEDQHQEALGRVELPEPFVSETQVYQFHPTLLDACLQTVIALKPEIALDQPQDIYLPVSLKQLRLYRRPGPRLWSQAQLRAMEGKDAEIITGDFRLFDEIGETVMELTGLRFKRARPESLQRVRQKSALDLPGDWLYEVAWRLKTPQPAITPDRSAPSGPWLIFTDQEGIGASLARRLEEQGNPCIMVVPGNDYRRPITGSVADGTEAVWQINPAYPADFERLLQEALPVEAQSWRGLVHLWSVDTPPFDTLNADQLFQGQVVNCGSVLHLVQALAKMSERSFPSLYLVTCGVQPVGAIEEIAAAQAPLWGLGQTIVREYPDLSCLRVDLDPSPEANHGQLLFEEIWAGDGEDQIAFRDKQRYVARLVRQTNTIRPKQSQLDSQPLRLDISTRGTIDNLALRPAARRRPGPGEVEVRVRATGLNFRDVLKVLGMYPGDPGLLGDEFAGEIVALGADVEQLQLGDKVLGIASGSFGTFVTTKANLVVPKPDEISFEEAATIPIVFLTAYYALHHLAKISAGDRVLIHAAAGGVGLAAVQLAQRAGAEIFGTAGNPEKRAFLQSIGVPYVMDSRSLDFADEVLTYTQGEGVDIILNSLNGDFIPKNLLVLKENGRFLEIGKIGIWDEKQVAEVKPNASYFPIFLGDQMEEQPDLVPSMLLELVNAFKAGLIKPLPRRVFSLEEASQAFRFMAQAKHIGKVVVSQASQSEILGSDLIRTEATYLITGGLGGLGLVIAQWLVDRGARHLVLVGRHKASEKASMVLKQLEQAGASLVVAQADISCEEDVRQLLSDIDRAMPPLRGIIHAAGILDDGMLFQQEWSRFEKVMAPKIKGGWYLHHLTKEKSLDFFVLFSTGADLLGSPGQSNYVAANTFLDMLAHHRQARGLVALSINWGPWAEVGMAAALDSETQKRWARLGVRAITPEQGSQFLEQALLLPVTQIGILPIDWPVYLRSFSGGHQPSLFAEIVNEVQAYRRELPSPAQKPELLEVLAKAPASQYRDVVVTYVRNRARTVLGLDPHFPINPQQPLSELGLDSLMAVELRNLLNSAVGQVLPVSLLFDYPTLETLVDYLGREVLALENMAKAGRLDKQITIVRREDLAEPIAIIGLGLRFPGGANDPVSFWQLLRDGVDTVTEIPASRWNVEAYYDPTPGVPGKMQTRGGGFLEKIDQFDPQFFGIAPREAMSMDPQQRLLLEVSWEALEHAGQAPDQLKGSQTGVFIGISNNDYYRLLTVDMQNIDAYLASGNSLSVAAGRLSYVLGLQGPSIAVDTACSASLVAIHLACQSLRHRESDLALAGGVNLILSPEGNIIFSQAHMMAADDRCKTFDAAADGYVRGEGCAVVVLKRLSDALADGDHIQALIRGTAINQDGRSNGLTAPNGPSQETVIRRALADGGVEPAQISYIEAHGTGTPLGDPIEVQALVSVFGQDRPPDRPLAIGSVKTNVGHLESAAGIAGLIKVILALQHKEIPPHLHLKEPNPFIPWDKIPVVIPTKRTPWPTNGGPHMAGVSSFGFSGTNAHVVLEAAPEPEITPVAVDRPLHLLTLSAKDQAALKALITQYASYLAETETGFENICFTTNTGRAHLSHRLAVVAASSAQAGEQLAAFAAGDSLPGVVSNDLQTLEAPKVVFLFTGQGSQYVEMGRQLYETQPLFRQTLDRCNELLQPYLGRSLLAILYSKTEETAALLDETAYTQPALFALEYALAELWRSWGIEPAAALGHSVGEYVAACIAGVFSLEDGLKLMAERGRLMQLLPKNGSMAVVFADKSDVLKAIHPYSAQVAIAAVNGPQNVVISGETGAMEAALAALEADGLKMHSLNTSHAFHSPLMEPILGQFEQVAGQVQFRPPQLPLVSNITGQLFGSEELPDAAYWRRHLRAGVHFAAGIETLYEQGYRLFLEVGPNPTLLGMARRCLAEEGRCVWLPSLRKGRADWQQMLESLGTLYTQGAAIDWNTFAQGAAQRRRLPLPTYPFQRQRYWVDPPQMQPSGKSNYPQPDKLHPLLGQRLRSPAIKDVVFEGSFSHNWPSGLGQYQLSGLILTPASIYIEMALTGVVSAFGMAAYSLKELTLHEPLVLSENEIRATQLILVAESQSNKGASRANSAPAAISFRIVSLGEDEEEWKLHAAGKLSREQVTPLLEEHSPEAVQARCPDEVKVDEYYQQRYARGVEFKPNFRLIQRLWRHLDDGEALAQAQLPEMLAAEGNKYQLHPLLLESCIQLFGLLGSNNNVAAGPYWLVGLDDFRIHRPPSKHLWAHIKRRSTEGSDEETIAGDLRLLNDSGELIAEAVGMNLRRVSPEALLQMAQGDSLWQDWLYQLSWQPQARPITQQTQAEQPGNWLIFTDLAGVGLSLARHLQERGENCVLVRPGQAYESIAKGQWQINPTESVDFVRLLVEALPVKETTWQGVIHLWSTDIAPSEEINPTSLLEAQGSGCGSVLPLVQAIMKTQQAKLPRLWLVTQAAQPVLPNQQISPAQSPIWGLGHTLTLESPELQCVQIDLEPSVGTEAGRLLFEEVWLPDRENRIAFRDNTRYVARLRRTLPPTTPTLPQQIQAEATYLITGGFGDLGLQVARWLAEQGARHLILLGRRGAASEAARQAVGELEQEGVQVIEARGDVAQLGDLSRILTGIERPSSEGGLGLPPLRGVIHAAGVATAGVRLLQDDWLHFTQIMSPKVEGAWLLHTLTRNMPLDFFVLFSSASSILGLASQASYAAANSFLDALAHYRRTQGLPALSINWGAWSDMGMMAVLNSQQQQLWVKLGMGTISPSQGLNILERVLFSSATQIGVLPVNWPVYLQSLAWVEHPPLLDEIAQEIQTRSPAEQLSSPAPKLLEQLAVAAPDEHLGLVLAHLCQQVTRVLRLNSGQLIDPHLPLLNFGLDSLMAIELRNQIKAELSIEVPVVNFLQGQSLAQIAAEVLSQLQSGSSREADSEILSEPATDNEWEVLTL